MAAIFLQRINWFGDFKMNIPLLKVRNLSVRLDNELIIDNLSFDSGEGDVLTILGPNGAGKTVLLKTLLGLFQYEGEIVWQKKFRMGYLPQGLNQLSVKELPLTIRDFFNLSDKNLSKADIADYLNMVGLPEEILHKKASNLSGGQFKRMLLSWVLIGKPQILFLDEPTTGLDIGGGETIYSLLKRIHDKEKLTIFLVTHDLNIVYGYSTNVLCLSKLGYSCFGKPNEILTSKTLEDMFGDHIKIFEHNHQIK